MIVEALIVTGVLALVYKYRAAIAAKFKGEVTVVASKGTAFARLAEQEGKVVASGYAWSGNLPCGCRGESHSCRTR